MTDRICSVAGCDRPFSAKSLCGGHYQRLRTGRAVDGPLQVRTLDATLAERFWKRVEPTAADVCWPWLGPKSGNGYGQLPWSGRVLLAHRVSYELATGVAPGPMVVCHHCDNPPCCNPSHLFLGSQSDNMSDAAVKGRLGSGGRLGLPFEQVLLMRERLAAGDPPAVVGPAFGVSRQYASDIGRMVRRVNR